MNVSTLASSVAAYLDATLQDNDGIARPMPDFVLLRHRAPTQLEATLYEPVVCLILQGAKETSLGTVTTRLAPGQSLVVSHDLPVVSRITRASRDQPYLAAIFTLDLPLLRSLYDEVGDALEPADDACAMAASVAGPRLLDAVSRYLALADDPVEARIMAASVRREILFRLLMAPNGAMLRRLLRFDSHESNIARAIARIRNDFRAPLAIPELARASGMSTSSFHKHFKDVTSTTPLQYQKELRLLEARRLLATGGQSVTNVAYEVGYESPSQFSREYSRKFGAPPSAHADAARA